MKIKKKFHCIENEIENSGECWCWCWCVFLDPIEFSITISHVSSSCWNNSSFSPIRYYRFSFIPEFFFSIHLLRFSFDSVRFQINNNAHWVILFDSFLLLLLLLLLLMITMTAMLMMMLLMLLPTTLAHLELKYYEKCPVKTHFDILLLFGNNTGPSTKPSVFISYWTLKKQHSNPFLSFFFIFYYLARIGSGINGRPGAGPYPLDTCTQCKYCMH